jgi:Spy/CpxP family protein refolding chaperone
MTLSAARRLLVMGCIVALGSPALAASQAPPRSFWWRSEHIRNELGLSADQSARIDKIIQNTMPELRQEFEELGRLESKLTRLIEGSSDEALIARQIDRVETARANLNKTRSLMLYRMRQVLNPEQHQRLKALQERREHEQRQSGAGRPGADPRGNDGAPGKPRPEKEKRPNF